MVVITAVRTIRAASSLVLVLLDELCEALTSPTAMMDACARSYVVSVGMANVQGGITMSVVLIVSGTFVASKPTLEQLASHAGTDSHEVPNGMD